MIASMTACGNETTSPTPTEPLGGPGTSSATASASMPPASSQPVQTPLALDPALIERAREQGRVSIIVTLAVPYHPEAELAGPKEVAAQRTAIATAQDGLVASVPNATVTTRMTLFPQIVLDVDETTLHRLATSPLVLAIDANSPSAPTR